MPKTPSSTPTLHSQARHVVVPDGIVSTGWAVVRAKCSEMGISFDPWQEGAGKLFFAKRDNGRFAASRGGVCLSIPRQVGKTFLIGSIVFAMCLLEEKSKVIWTAHRTTTADETFDAMKEMAQMPTIAPFIDKVRQANGEQRIIFKNGSRVEFGAREMGFGRGKTRVKVLVLDEGQILSESAMENLVPTMNRAHNPLMFIMGTPPRPQDNGEMFLNKRTRALAGDSKDTLYIEFSADRDAKIHDKDQWAVANPSYPLHTDEDAIMRMMESFGEDSFRREALGIWDEEALAAAAVKSFRWESLVEDSPSESWPLVSVGVDMNPEMTKVSIGAAMLRDDDRHHLELMADAPFNESGTADLVDWLWGRCKRRIPVAIDAFSPARDLLEARLIQRGVTVKILTANDCVSAAALFSEAVDASGAVTHFDQEQLNDSVRGSVREHLKNRPSSYKFSRQTLADDVAPLNSVAWALYGAIKFARRRRSSGESSKRRHAVVL